MRNIEASYSDDNDGGKRKDHRLEQELLSKKEDVVVAAKGEKEVTLTINLPATDPYSVM